MDRRLIVAALVAASVTVSAQMPIAVNHKQVRKISADRACRIDAQGRQISPWVSLKTDSEVAREAPAWAVAWDALNCDPSGATPAFWSNQYAPNSSAWYFGDQWRNYMWANDMVFAPGTAGKQAQYFGIWMSWNPLGTNPASGIATCVIDLFPANTCNLNDNGPAADKFLPGVRLSLTDLGPGGWWISSNLSGLGWGIPIPIDNGSIVVRLATTDSLGNVIALQAPAAAQPVIAVMHSPGDPEFPGTNPSSSSEFQWDDDRNTVNSNNEPDYVFQDLTNTASLSTPFSELYSYNWGAGYGIQQATVGYFVDTNALSISGKVNWGDLADPTAGPNIATFNIVDTVSSNSFTSTVAVLPDGSYFLLDPQPTTGGQYEISMKNSHWLNRMVTVDTTDLSNKTVDFDMVNGDIDDDNAVTVFDYNALSDAFDSAPGDGNWNAMADLDGDGGVTVFDYNILSANFDMVGD